MSVLQPQIGEVNSSVTAQAGVADTSGVDLFSAAAGTAVKAGFSLSGKAALKDLSRDLDDIAGERASELSNLRNNLGKIAQVKESGADVSALRNKARALVDKTRADTPWVAEQAEAMYTRVLGAGASGSGALGGVFAESPEEKALAKFNESVAEVQVSRGYSREKAIETIRFKDSQAELKAQYELRAEQGKVDGDAINNYVNQNLTIATVSAMDKIDQVRRENGGSIPAPVIMEMEREIDRQGAAFLQNALKGLTDADGNPVTNAPNKAAIDGVQADVESWITKQKAMLQNNSTTKMLGELTKEKDAQVQNYLANNLDAIDIINKKWGQAGVTAAIEMASQKEGVLKDFLKSANPRVAAMLDDSANVPKLLNSTYNQLIGVKGEARAKPLPEVITKRGLTDDEALVAGTLLNGPTFPATLLYTVFDRSVEDVKSREAIKSMLAKDNDSFKMLTGEKFKNYIVKNEGSAKKVADIAIEAARESFQTISFANTGEFRATNFELKVVTPAGKFGVPRVTAVGEGLTSESVGVINNLYRMFKANPRILDGFLRERGLPTELTPEQATQAALLGGVRGQEVLFPGSTEPSDTLKKVDKAVREGLSHERDSSIEDNIKARAQAIDKKALLEFKAQLSPEDFKEIFGEGKPNG